MSRTLPALAGVTGILTALYVDITPTMGMDIMIVGMVAFIIGGVEKKSGVIPGALALGLLQQIAVWFIGAQWQSAIAFIILFIFLLMRPQGFLGKPIQRSIRWTTV